MAVIGGACEVWLIEQTQAPQCEPEDLTAEVVQNRLEKLTIQVDSFEFEYDRKITPNGEYYEIKAGFVFDDAIRLALLQWFSQKNRRFFCLLFSKKITHETYLIGDQDHPLELSWSGSVGEPTKQPTAKVVAVGKLRQPCRFTNTSDKKGDFSPLDWFSQDFSI